MIQITLCLYPRQKSGEVNLEFLLVDGKTAGVKYISAQLVPVKELHAFTLDGSVHQRAKSYDVLLKAQIDRIIPAMKEAYIQLRIEGKPVNEESFHKAVDQALWSYAPAGVPGVDREETLRERFQRFVDEICRSGKLSVTNQKQWKVLNNKLNRYLRVKDVEFMGVGDFTQEMILEFEKFIRDEYLYAESPKYAAIYPREEYLTFPNSQLGRDTVRLMMKLFCSFWDALLEAQEITESPSSGYAETLNKPPRQIQQLFGGLLALKQEDFQRVLSASVPERLLAIRDFFVLQCMLGMKEKDLQLLTLDNVSVSRGIPYVHYVPLSRLEAKTSQKRRRKIPEVKVPLVRAAYDIVKRTGLRFDVPLQAYNSLVSQLLRHSGVDREVELYDASREEVVVLPFCDAPQMNLAQRSFLFMLLKSETGEDSYWDGSNSIDMLYKISKGPLPAYREKLNKVFCQEGFKVNKTLTLISNGKSVEDVPIVYIEESDQVSYTQKGNPYLISTLLPMAGRKMNPEARVDVQKMVCRHPERPVRIFGNQYQEFIENIAPNERELIEAGLLLISRLPELPETLVTNLGEGLYVMHTDFKGHEYTTFFCVDGDELIVLWCEYMRDHSRRKKKLEKVSVSARACLQSYLEGRETTRLYDNLPASALDSAMNTYCVQILYRAVAKAGYSIEEFANKSEIYYRVWDRNRLGNWILRLKNLCRIMEALDLRAVILRPE